MPTTLRSEQVAARYAAHVNPAFVKLLSVLGYGRVFVRAEGCQLWDNEGRAYLDALAGFGSVNLGHNPPALRERLSAHLAGSPLNLAHVGPSAFQAEFAERLASLLDPSLRVTMFANSGGEAIEAALKLSRLATGRTSFLYATGGYHGLGFGALSVAGRDRMRTPFQPLLPACFEIPFGDLRALGRALAKHRPAAVVLEPIQAEGGVRLPPRGYLREAAALARRAGTLLVLDEVQTGLGRTGALFAHQHPDEAFVPDVLVLGKSLGGSLLPLAVAVTSPELHGRAFGSLERFDLHGSTFAGNALACVAGLATLELSVTEDLAKRAEARGERLRHGLARRLTGHPLVREIRGRGLLIGVELGAEKSLRHPFSAALGEGLARTVLSQWIAFRMLEAGVLCQPASQAPSVLRFSPPLTIEEPEIDRIVDIAGDAFDACREPGPVLERLLKTVASRGLSGFPFPADGGSRGNEGSEP